MTALAKLETAIADFLKASGGTSSAFEKMQAVEARLRGAVKPGSALPETGICRAVADFHANGAEHLSRREVRALCAGFHHSCANCNDAPRLIDADPETLKPLFFRMRKAFKEGHFSIESWYDLMRCYLDSSDRTQACEKLRELLEETFPSVSAVTPYPFTWLSVIADNGELLGAEPMQAAAQAPPESEGDIALLRDLLELPDHSWYWKELTIARVKETVQMKDNAFTAELPALLQAAHFLPENWRDEAVRLMLERYLKNRDLPHDDIKHFITDHWGAPKFSDSKFDFVGVEARRMVQEWIFRDDVQDFFMHQQDGGATDERRFAFWQRYAKSVEYHRILLGPQAHVEHTWLHDHPSAGRLLDDDVNAVLLMKIGGWIWVETGDAQQPLYAYRFAKPPFDIEAAEISLPCFSKKIADYRVQREDTLEGQWEDKLSPELATMGVRHEPVVKRKAPVITAAAAQAVDRFDAAQFDALVKAGRLDAERQDGRIHVAHDHADNYYLAQMLARWGFRWQQGQGWWRG